MLTPVITHLLVINGLLFVLQANYGDQLIALFALWPLGTPEMAATPGGYAMVPEFRPWQVVTYAFLHGGFLHLAVNLFALWMFGLPLEQAWGSRRFAFYFFFCIVGAGLVQLVVATIGAQDGAIYPTVGASGGVFGVLLAFAVMYPNQRLILLIPPVPIKAKWFVILYGIFELWAGVTGTLAGIAHFAHLGGMFFGLVLILYWRSQGAWPFPRR